MSQAAAMLDAYPKDLGGVDPQALTACIESCVECAKSVPHVQTPASARRWSAS